MNFPYAVNMNQEEYDKVKAKLKKSAQEDGIGFRYNTKKKIMATLVDESKLIILTEPDFSGLNSGTRRKVEMTLNLAKAYLEEIRTREEGWIE